MSKNVIPGQNLSDLLPPFRFLSKMCRCELSRINSFQFMPFGAGPRNCIGMRFALVEIKLTLVKIMRRFKFVRSPETQVPLMLNAGATLTARDGVLVRLETLHWISSMWACERILWDWAELPWLYWIYICLLKCLRYIVIEILNFQNYFRTYSSLQMMFQQHIILLISQLMTLTLYPD